MSKPRLKTTTLTVRIEPGIKSALSAAAKSERRSLANMLEVMVLAWCEEHEVDAQPDEKENRK